MKLANVTVFGSLNYDFVILGSRLPLPGETVKGDSFLHQTGGKGANQALQAARLGGRTTMIGCIGKDFMGDAQFDCMRAEGVVVDYIVRHDTLPTGTALIFVDTAGQNEIMVSSGANAACTPATLDASAKAFENCDVFVTQMETGMDAILQGLRLARQAGCFCILDPAPVQSVPPELWAMADLVKPNETEAALYTGIPVDHDDLLGWAARAAEKLKAMGAPTVLITLGAKGSYYSGEQQFHTPSIPVRAVDATAAGDSFAGALAVAIGEAMPMRDAIAFASAAGAVTASRAGAQHSIGRRHEVEGLLRQVSG